ncbi:hypothetical protein SFUMM280S_10460 [Streptomyces fumanus]
MRRLFPVTDQTAAPDPDREWSLAELAAAYAYPDGDGGGPGVWLRANMVASLDGAAQHDGRSQPLSSAADMRIFGILRALADAVVVGAETVRAEGYRPARAREGLAGTRRAAGQGPVPAIAVVSAGLDLDFSLPLFTSPLVPTLILTGADAPGADRRRRESERPRGAHRGRHRRRPRPRRPSPRRARPHPAPHRGRAEALGQFVAAGVLDELCLTVAPMLTAGDAQRIAGGPAMAVPRRFVLASLLEEEGFLFSRYRRDLP